MDVHFHHNSSANTTLGERETFYAISYHDRGLSFLSVERGKVG
jgi:hypothetical protein